jgi:hypothetical protein
MITTSQEFEESTAFELYVLETVRPAIEQHGEASIDLRGGKTIAPVSININESLSAGAVDRLKDELAPLLFGAAWKVLDLLLEFALNRAGLSPAGLDLTIADKRRHALNASGDLSVLGCSNQVWAGVLLVYATTVEHRHCLVHRTAKVDATSGTLEGIDRNRQPLKPLTRDEQVTLAKASGLIARGVVGGGLDQRSEDHLKYYLDLLRAHSGLAAFGVGGASAPVDIMLTLVHENGRVILDMNDVLERARKTFQTVSYFNLLIDVPDGSGRRLFAQAEACPPGQTTIDLNALPAWLAFR